MILQSYQPAFPLNQFIDTMIYFEGFTPVHTLDRFLPDGNTELLIDLRDTPQFIHDNNTLEVIQVCKHAWVSGVRTRPITIPSGKDRRMIVVAFKKGRAYPFYPCHMSELTDSVVMADLVFGNRIYEVRERLLASKSIAEIFHQLELFLLNMVGDRLNEQPAQRSIEFVLRSIIHQPSMIRFQNLVDQIGYSQKHFIGMFKSQVGVTPKQYLRITRFQKAIQEMETNASSFDWSRLALQSGFYDQAHFINDFRDFSGFTPGEYMKRKTDSLNYVPVM